MVGYWLLISIFIAPVVRAECLLKDVPLNRDNWQVAYSGEGSVKISSQVTLAPKTSVKPNETHAALVLLKNVKVANDYKLQVEYINVKPNRINPNPWELFWLMFNYEGGAKNKKTNYFIVKTNGLELGQAYNEIDQKFSLTKPTPKITYQEKIKLTIVKTKQKLTILINDQLVVSGEYQLYNHPGTIGLYTEDAVVAIKAFKYCQW